MNGEKVVDEETPSEQVDLLCGMGRRCVDQVDGHAREVSAEGHLCSACIDRVGSKVEGFPEQYVRLHAMIGDRAAGVDAGNRRPKPGSAVLLNLHVDTLLGEIAESLTLAADVLSDRLNTEPPSHSNPAEQVQKCARLVAPMIHTLAHITGIGGREPNDPTIDTVAWNATGTIRFVSSTTGFGLLKTFDYLHNLAYFTLGQTLARTRRDVPCTRCHAKTVGRWAGSEHFDCSTCGSRFVEDDIRRQDKILVELLKRGILTP